MAKPWFKAKKYGWGGTPASWQGWTILGLYVILVVKLFIYYDSRSHSVSDTLINFVPVTLGLTAVLIWICWRTGEPGNQPR